MTKKPFLALCVIAAFSLSACETFQADVNKSYADIQQAFKNFQPFEMQPINVQPINEVAATEPATPPAPLSDSEKAESNRLAAIAKTRATLPKLQTKPTPETKTTTIAQKSTSGTTCPNVRIVNDLNQVHQFTDPSNPKPNESTSSVQMQNVDSNCNMVKGSMSIDMTIAFAGKLGPKARARAGDKPSFAYPYFVAITNNQGSIVAKEVFAVTLNYDSGRNQETHTEQIRQLIPMKDNDYKNYKVLIGFQVTDQELAYNRASPSMGSILAIEPAAGASKKQ